MIDLSSLDIFGIALMSVALAEHDKGNELNRDLSLMFREAVAIRQKKVVTLAAQKTVAIRWADYTAKDLESTQREFFIFAAALEKSNTKVAEMADRIAGQIARVLWLSRMCSSAREKLDALKNNKPSASRRKPPAKR